MELNKQIKKYRTMMNLSQEDLAEHVYVTRQTISNWETGKSYPDIHSLLLLSSLFNVSLDTLIKGDLEMMREKVNEKEIREFNFYGSIFSVLLIGNRPQHGAAGVFPRYKWIDSSVYPFCYNDGVCLQG